MSIIYEALKKLSPGDAELRESKEASVQDGSPQESNPPQKLIPLSAALKPRAVFLRIALALGGITIGILVTWIIMNKLTAPLNSPTASPIKEAQPVHPALAPPLLAGVGLARRGEVQEAPELILNGIVLSADGNLALINEEIVRVGDDIREAKVEEITDKQVTLTFQGQKIILKK